MIETFVKYTIDELNPLLPPSSGPIAEGDDHLNNLKTVLKTQFPDYNNTCMWSAKKLNNVYAVNSEDSGSWVFSGQIYEPVFADPNKLLSLDGTNSLVFSPFLPPIGVVNRVMLSLQQLNEVFGLGVFQYCDGTDVTGSAYHTQTGRSVTPNLFGLAGVQTDGHEASFIRPAETDENLGEESEFSTAFDGMTLGKTSIHSHYHEGPQHAHFTDYQVYTEDNYITNYLLGSEFSAQTSHLWSWWPSFAQSSFEESNIVEKEHSHQVSYENWDIESCPKAVLFNFVMRVN